MPSKPMILTAFFFNPQGDNRMSWRAPNAPRHEVYGLDYYRRLALAAENAKMDAIFVADHVAMWDTYASNVRHYANARLEPVTLLAALAAVTKNIGLIATASTSYSEPYNLARALASIDHISDGRMGWNVVTSAMNEEALNFGRDGNTEHARRYERAAEFVEVAKELWDSIEGEALLIDKTSGDFADPARVHRIDHAGKYFKVRGPLNVPRPPQGYPLIVQAGSSRDGMNFAARHADVNFAIYRSIEEGRKYRADFDMLLAENGRNPDSFKILPGILPVVADSRGEAEERQGLLANLIPERLAVDLVSSWCGIDMSSLPVDGPLPPLPEEESYHGQRSNLAQLRAFATKNMTIRDVAKVLATAGAAPVFAGTPTDIADQLEAWFTGGAADGFNLMFPVLPDDWIRFAESVVPELQRRGIARKNYSPGILRERLGLQRPANRFAIT
jgi:FMN-dependent oxidoreductase (nitrilotriacetate monooxygenase family)